MDISTGDIWLLWGGVGALLLVPLALHAITRPLERKLDRLQDRSAGGWVSKLLIVLVISTVAVTTGYYAARGNFDPQYERMTKPR
jgi:hypothetical protein